jgi:hypothetical protein
MQRRDTHLSDSVLGMQPDPMDFLNLDEELSDKAITGLAVYR